MNSWLIYTLLSAMCASFTVILSKIGLQNVDTNIATMIRAYIMAIFLIIKILMQGKGNSIPTVFENKKEIFFIILSGIAGALSWLFYFLAIKNGNVSKVASLDKLSVLFTVILAITFLGERLSPFSINWNNLDFCRNIICSIFIKST